MLKTKRITEVEQITQANENTNFVVEYSGGVKRVLRDAVFGGKPVVASEQNLTDEEKEQVRRNIGFEESVETIIPIYKLPAYKTQPSYTGSSLKVYVNVLELENLSYYHPTLIDENYSNMMFYFAVPCEDGTEKIIAASILGEVFVRKDSDKNLIQIHVNNFMYEIDINNISTSSNVVVKTYKNFKYVPVTGDAKVGSVLSVKTLRDDNSEIPTDYEWVDHLVPPATAEVGQLLSVKAVDDNGKPTEWEVIDNACDWNTMQNKPFGEGIATIEIISEQTVLFSDGELQELNIDTSQLEYPAECTLIVNDKTYTGTVAYHNMAMSYIGDFVDYEFFCYEEDGASLNVFSSAGLNEGDNVTVHMYCVANKIDKIDPKFLPKEAATCVSYEIEQSLTLGQKSQARRNINAYETGRVSLYTANNVLQGTEITENETTFQINKYLESKDITFNAIEFLKLDFLMNVSGKYTSQTAIVRLDSFADEYNEQWLDLLAEKDREIVHVYCKAQVDFDNETLTLSIKGTDGIVVELNRANGYFFGICN